MAIKVATQEEKKLSESAKLGKFWVYDSKEDEFFLELSSTEVAEKLGISMQHVHALVRQNGYYKNRWIVFDGSYGSPSKFLAHFPLPSRIIIEAKVSLSKIWGKKIYNAYYSKYRSHRQIIQLNSEGKEIAAFKTWNECAEALGIKRSTVQSIVNNAKTLKRRIPNICFREDYAEVYEKYYKSKWVNRKESGKRKEVIQ